MRIKSQGLAFVLIILGSGCASRGKQSQTFLASSPKIAESFQVSNVLFIKQSENYCGPASLAMVMNWAGRNVTADELGTQIFTPGKKGALQEDLIGASRRNGMLAIRIHGIPNLLTEIAAGHPVIVLQNLLVSWYPQWHYSVAVGYDLKTKELIMHSGPDAFKKIKLERFEEDWSRADYWGVVILPPSQLSATANDIAHAESAAVFENLGKNAEAEEVYKSILKKWPLSLSAFIGLGNTRYKAKDYLGSIKYLKLATQNHPKEAMAWHNLAVAQGAGKLSKQARKSALKALEFADPKDLARYRDSLKDWLN